MDSQLENAYEAVLRRNPAAKYDADGNIWLLGRVDDVMNVSGHRLSTAEIESALVSHPAVAEAAVVGLAAGAAMAWPLTSENMRTRWITAGVALAAACVAIWALTIPSTLPVY